jgi:hypothetical protein
MWRAWLSKSTFATSLYLRRASFFPSSSVMMINPSEYHEVYGGGADDRVERRGRTGGSSVHPWGSVNLIDELCVALMPPRKRVSFPLGGAVSSSILRGDSETECLLEGCRWWLGRRWSLLLGEKTCSFVPWLQHSPSQIYIRGFQPVKRYTNIILEYELWVELGCVLLNQTNGVDG